MSELSKKDVEILNLKSARMSTASIAMMVGWSEAKVYNRLNALQVFSSGDALDRLAGRPAFSLAGWGRIGDETLTLLMGALARAAAEVATASPPPVIHVVPPVGGQIEELYVGGVEYVPAAPAPPEPAVVRVEAVVVEPRPAPPRSAPLRSPPGRSAQAGWTSPASAHRGGPGASAGRRIRSPAASRTPFPSRRSATEARQPTGCGVGGPLPSGAVAPGGSGPSVRRGRGRPGLGAGQGGLTA